MWGRCWCTSSAQARSSVFIAGTLQQSFDGNVRAMGVESDHRDHRDHWGILVPFFAAPGRRNVFNVAVSCAVVGWLLVEIAATVSLTFDAPQRVLQTTKLVIILVAATGESP